MLLVEDDNQTFTNKYRRLPFRAYYKLIKYMNHTKIHFKF